MKKLVNQFIKVRKEFIETLKKFPIDQVDKRLFGEWNLKDVLAHLAGWDTYFTEILSCLKRGNEIPYWSNIEKFNENSVGNRKYMSWNEVYDEFVSSGEEFIKEYLDVRQDYRSVRFWKKRSYTPTKILEINIHHYEKNHLDEIKEKLGKLGKNN